MNQRVELALILIVHWALVTAAFGQAPTADPVHQEWRIRALALDSARIELGYAESWTEEWEHLEALRRRLLIGRGGALAVEEVGQLVVLLAHSAPNVRAASLACLQLSKFDEWDAALIDMLSRDPLPEVRSRLCLALSPDIWSEHLGTLQELAWSQDEEVRRAARRVLYGLGPGEPEAAQAKLLTTVLREQGTEAYLSEVESWWRVRQVSKARFPIGDAARVLAEMDASGSVLRAGQALWIAAEGRKLSAEEAAIVADGWCEPLSRNWGQKHRIQRKLLLAAARTGGEALALELLVVVEERAHSEESPARELSLEDLFEGLLESADVNWLLTKLLALPLKDTDLALFWSLADTSKLTWEPAQIEPWLAADRAVVLRAEVGESLARAFANSGDEAARTQLIGLLQDTDSKVHESAFRALCGAESQNLETVEPALFVAWERQSKAERLRLLRQLPRARSLPSFRASLLTLGENESARHGHPSILELLGKFKGDRECAEQLEVWLRNDVEYLSEVPVPRAAEIAARGGVRALHSVAGKEAVFALSLALRSCLSTSTDVAKTCAWCLGSSGEGRGVLLDYIGESTPTRIRVEAALAFTAGDAGPLRSLAITVLLGRFENCDNELRGRILKALSKTGEDTARDFALELITSAETSPSLSAQALEILRARYEGDPSDANFESLAGCIKSAGDSETRRVVVELVGATRDSRGKELLKRRLGHEPESLGAEREELLIALARVAPDSLRLWSALWRRPHMLAKARLENRFRGRPSAAVAFSFRGEIGAVKECAAVGELDMAVGPVISKLGAGLALALGEVCRAASAVNEFHAVDFESAGLVALAGESVNDKTRLAGLRARARLWHFAERRGRHFQAARLAEGLLEDWIAKDLTDRDLETLFGAFDAAGGVDPLARLASSNLQSRARLAAIDGDSQRVEQLLAEARASLGFSAAARRAQEELERDLR